MNKDYEMWNKPKTDEEIELEKKEQNALTTPESFYHDSTEVGPVGDDDRYYEVFEKSKTKSMWWSVASLMAAVVSVLCSFFGWVGLIIGVASVVLAVISRKKLGYFDKFCIFGLIVGIFGIVFSGVDIILSSINLI